MAIQITAAERLVDRIGLDCSAKRPDNRWVPLGQRPVLMINGRTWGGNETLITEYVGDRAWAHPRFTIAAIVITQETISDDYLLRMREHSRYLQAPIFVSDSEIDRVRGPLRTTGRVKKVRITDTTCISGAD